MQPLYGNVFIPATRTIKTPTPLAVNKAAASAGAGSFGDILSQKSEEYGKLQFSKHAEMRLRSRDIELTESQMQRAEEGVIRAKSKGIRDSLVLVDDVALVINTKNSIVITALESGADSVFTNIDGAVIV